MGFIALELGPEAKELTRKHLSPIFSSVATYLESCSEQGTLRAVDSFTTVVGFVFTVVANRWLYEVVTGAESQSEDLGEAVARHTKYWTQVLLPQQERTCAQTDQWVTADLEIDTDAEGVSSS